VLARRALVHLPFHVLRRISDDPVRDIADGRHAALADAELEWCGIRPPRRYAPSKAPGSSGIA
jgi:hypothetical protein